MYLGGFLKPHNVSRLAVLRENILINSIIRNTTSYYNEINVDLFKHALYNSSSKFEAKNNIEYLKIYSSLHVANKLNELSTINKVNQTLKDIEDHKIAVDPEINNLIQLYNFLNKKGFFDRQSK